MYFAHIVDVLLNIVCWPPSMSPTSCLHVPYWILIPFHVYMYTDFALIIINVHGSIHVHTLHPTLCPHHWLIAVRVTRYHARSQQCSLSKSSATRTQAITKNGVSMSWTSTRGTHIHIVFAYFRAFKMNMLCIQNEDGINNLYTGN